MSELIARARHHAARTALIDAQRAHTYADLMAAADGVAARLGGSYGVAPGDRVCALVEPGIDFVATLWGAWMRGAVLVPLATSHPAAEHARLIDDARPRVIVAQQRWRASIDAIAWRAGCAACSADDLRSAAPGRSPDPTATPAPAASDCDPASDDAALMVFTSGTTGRPKGVVTTHANVGAQISSVADAWGMGPDDRLLHALPLHHLHGLIVALGSALWAGASCEFLGSFDATTTWNRLASGDVTVFMGVPSMYHRLVAAWDSADPSTRARWSSGAAGLRLMTCGSAALPVTTLERWEAITGQRLLERYGMTEIGIAASNELDGERIAGCVGKALAGVEARITSEDGESLSCGSSGQLEVRGPQVFREYWGQPDATAQAFRDGWFLTGDEAEFDAAGRIRIVGRRSVDIIKTGGYKVSALEIEAALRLHPGIDDVAVVGVADDAWGECVCAAVVSTDPPSLETLRAWCKERLAPYKAPRRLLVVDELPRNALGKVLKPQLWPLFAEPGA